MEIEQTAGIEEHFRELKDPRIDRSKLHKLIDILVMAICAVICGADTWEEKPLVRPSRRGLRVF